AAPVPLRPTVAVLPVVELLWMAMLPVTAPDAVGLNCTCKVIVCLGCSVAGSVPLTMVKPVPEMAAEFTVTAEVPVEVRSSDIALAVFTVTLPKGRLVGLTVNCGLVAAAPVPLRPTVAVLPLVELLWIAMLPVTAPDAVGLNCTCKVIVCLGCSVAGSVPLTMVKPVPEMAAEFTVTAEVPVEVRSSDIALAVFTVTLPKGRLVGLTVNCGLVAAAPVPLRPTVAVL